MDRFIEQERMRLSLIRLYLKSNMDRFIGGDMRIKCEGFCALKSNMDRFIVYKCGFHRVGCVFKIQYG